MTKDKTQNDKCTCGHRRKHHPIQFKEACSKCLCVKFEKRGENNGG